MNRDRYALERLITPLIERQDRHTRDIERLQTRTVRLPWINAVDLGADPTGVTDSSTHIQGAIDAAEAVGGTPYVPPGTYRLNTGLTWLHATSADRGNITIIGSGYDTVFQAGADGLTLLTVDQSSSNYQGMLIEGIRFEMGNYSGRALHVRRGGSLGKLHRLWARGGTNITGGLIELGVEATTEVTDFTIEDVYCYANVFTTDRPAFGMLVGALNTVHINHYSSVGPAIGFANQVSPVRTSSDVRLSQCRFENGVYGVKYESAGLLGYTIRDSRFEDLSAAGISIEGYDASNPATSGVIEGCYFTSLSDTGEVGVFDGRRQGIALEKVAGLQISGNYFNAASAGTGNAIYFVTPVNITGLALMANYMNPAFPTRTTIPNYSTTLEINDVRAMQASKDISYAAGGGYRQVIDGWYYDNAAASLSAAAMTRLGGTAEDSYVCMRAGSITGVSVRTSSPRTAGTLTATVYRDGAAIGLTAVLDGTNTIFKATTQGMDVNTFAAGGRLDVRLTTSADWAPTTADIRAAIEVEM